jgi:anti-anti-sigma regulatory factor
MTAQPIRIPKSGWNDRARDMRSTLQTWVWHPRPRPEFDSVVLDFAAVEFMEPWALALFASYALQLRQIAGLHVSAALDASLPAQQYLEQMGLVELVNEGRARRATAQWQRSKRSTGLYVIASHRDIQEFVESAEELGDGENQNALDALEYCMSELGRNAFQHAHARGTAVAIAQYFPKDRRIQIAICDRGKGVRQSLAQLYPEIRNDDEALRLAILPHVSSAQSTGWSIGSENAGLGLFYSKEIAWRTGGSFWIASGKALLGVEARPGATEPMRLHRSINDLQGTAVVLDFPSKAPAELTDLLAKCREEAELARRSPGEAGLQFAADLPELENPLHLRIREFAEDIERAREIREHELIPALRSGRSVVIDFEKVRFATQSFAHALLRDAFKVEGSLLRMTFVGCTSATQQVVRAVAAYSATYRPRDL